MVEVSTSVSVRVCEASTSKSLHDGNLAEDENVNLANSVSVHVCEAAMAEASTSKNPHDVNLAEDENVNLAEDENKGKGNQKKMDTVEREKFLPLANILMIMRRGLPPKTKVAHDAVLKMQEFASEFISFVTNEANEKCISEKRKTVMADDLLWAMNSLGFENYNDTLQIFLQKYNEYRVGNSNLGNELFGGDLGKHPTH